MKALEAKVRTIEADGLVWGSCKYFILNVFSSFKFSTRFMLNYKYIYLVFAIILYF